MIKVKICGLSTPETVEAALSAGASFIGFVAYPKSPRHVEPEHYAALAKLSDIPTVLVTVDMDDERVDSYLQACQPDYVQCHGKESPQRLDEIRRKGVKIIKGIGIATATDIEKVGDYRDAADILLLDAKPKTGELPGGNAKSFDWSLLHNVSIEGDWMLSGGVNSQNVHTALSQTGASMLDVSSGVESAPGVKDVDLIKTFVKTSRFATSTG